jgi:ABC-type sugar transport system substrate-binding protein
MRKSILAVAITASASVVLASALAPAATASAPAADKGVTAAKAIVKQYSGTPKTINITTPLKVSPKTLPTKLIVGLSNGGAENKTLNDGLAAGGAVLGWTFKEVSGADTPENQRAAFQQALDLKPSGIHISGIEPSTLGDLLGKAKAAKIPVICSACMSAPTSALVDTHIAGKRQLDVWGRMIAAYVVANTASPVSHCAVELLLDNPKGLTLYGAPPAASPRGEDRAASLDCVATAKGTTCRLTTS